MTNALGPVLGNRFSANRTTTVKPHLQQRLAAQVQRTTPEGTFKTAPDGRMEFVPKMAPTHNQQVLQRMQALKSEPTQEMREKAAEEMRVRQEFIDSTRARMRKALYGLAAAPAEGDDEREAMGVPQPVMTLQDSFATLAMTPAELQQVMGPFGIVYGSPACAGHAKPLSTFGVGDTVLRISGRHAGLTGTVASIDSDGRPFVSFPGLGMACNPAFLRLVKKAGA